MLGNLDFSHEPDLNKEILAKRVEVYFPDADFQQLGKAIDFAINAHRGQKRRSGEEYIIHPLNVAATLIKLRMDLDSIIAGLLHDVVEDCDVSMKDLEREFSPSIAEIVNGLTKISKIKFKTREESQAENFRKMVVAMAKDIRVIIVKLADRMHNMRTLQYVSDEKQRKIAQETLDIYVPLASRLGINSVKAELEDLCMRFIHPEIYYRLAEKVDMKKSERDKYIRDVVEMIKEKTIEYAVKCDVTGRSKHFYSIYKKMINRGVDFEQIHDVLAFRIIVQNIAECYKVLGIIHSSFTPVPGRFKDYIAIPKVNNYQSLHTTVVAPKGDKIEIQIRTYEMHEVAEAGIAAHWQYKEGAKNNKRLKWVEELLEYNQNLESNTDFLDVIKNDIDIAGIFIFTPKGDVFELKHGSSPLDFAYLVHTEVGNRCVGAKVNGKMVPLKHRLKSGDTVEILTSKSQTPSKDWLNIVKTTKAKTKIKQWLLKAERDKNMQLGEELLEKALKIYDSSVKSVRKKGHLNLVQDKFHCKNDEEILINIGAGKISVKDALDALPIIKNKSIDEDTEKKNLQEIDSYYQKLHQKAKRESNRDNAVLVDGFDDIMVRMARCCNPIPGDPIVGFITRGRGITVHARHCKKIDVAEEGRMINVEWNEHYRFLHPVNIRVITHDKPGILSSISKNINNHGINIKSAIAKSLPDQKGSFIFEVEVRDYSELLKTISMIEAMGDVISVTRA